ncbi:PREDICTED: uncharacterized protein LOC109146771 [Ipomoea nil]|uniref:uncharacterized protein LOC109146771 n=1 Tax=Ipomoea nil TaxID=35883 RepID=UPI000901BF4F|nr:PREDICTED: uncharacterized protein LOC109146771 [Ipomoea nil]
MLSVRGSVYNVVESRWLTPHLKAIKALWLCGSSLPYMDASLFATAINLQVLGLYELSFGCEKQLTYAMQLLQKCPNLCELRIMAHQVEYTNVIKKLLQDFWKIQMVALLFRI